MILSGFRPALFLGGSDMNERALHRSTDPDTSVEAAATVNVTKSEQRCYDYCKRHGNAGVTNSEAAAYLNLLPNTTSPRWRPMERKKIIMDSGQRRKNGAGRNEIVWVSTEAMR